MYYRNDITIIKLPQIWRQIAKNIRYQTNETEEYESVPDTGNDLLDETEKDNKKSNFVGRMLDGIYSMISFKGKDTIIVPNEINIIDEHFFLVNNDHLFCR